MALDLETLRARSTPARAGCSMLAVIDALDGDDLVVLRAALADAGITGTAIASALQGEGHDIKAATVNRHRKGECSCDAV